MESFLYFFQKYKKASFGRIFVEAYRTDQGINLYLLAYSIITILLIIIVSFNGTIYKNLIFILISIWSIWLCRAIKKRYSHYWAKYKELLQFYNKERQYLRYLIFRDILLNDSSSSTYSIRDALNYINIDLETETRELISTNLVITTSVAVIVSLISSYFGKLNEQYILLGLFFSVLTLFILIAVLGSIRNRKSKLLELKRFLLWLDQDATLTSRFT